MAGYFKNLFNAFGGKKEAKKRNPAGMELYASNQYNLGYTKSRVLLEEMRGWVFACVSAIADEIAQIEIKLYKRTGDDVEEVKDSPILDVLYKVNDFTTKFDHFWLTSSYLELTGEAPWYLEKDKDGITGIFFLNPSKLTPVADKEKIISGYKYDVGLGRKVDIPKENIIFLKFPNPANPFRGLGTLEAASRSVDVDNYSEEWNKNFFKNSARPDAILTVDEMDQMDEEQKNVLKNSITSQYKGVDKAQQMMVLFGKMKFEQFAVNRKDMDFLEQQKFTRDKILGIFRVPKAVVAQTEGVNFASAKAASYTFARWTIEPKMERIIEQLNEFYVPMFTGAEDMFLDFVNPIPEDEAIKLQNYEKGIDKWLTTNEIREAEGLPEVDGGDVIYKPINLIPMGTTNSDEDIQPEKGVVALKVINKIKSRLSSERHNQLNSRNPEKRKLDQKIKEVKKQLKDEIKEKLREEFYNTKAVLVKWSKEKKNRFWEKKDALSRRFIKPVAKKQRDVYEQQRVKTLKKLDSLKAIKASADISKLQLSKTEEAVVTIALVMPLLEELFKESADETFTFLGVDMVMDTTTEEVQKLLKANTRKFSNSATETTNAAIKNTVSEGLAADESIPQIKKRINNLFDVEKQVNAERIARTETIRFNEAANQRAFKESGVVKAKEWVIDPDACQFCLSMDGTIVDLDADFVKEGGTVTGTDGGTMTSTYGSTEYPPLHPNSYHKDTETYTKDGFKLIKDIKIGDKVLSLNPKTFNLEWVKVKNLVSHNQDKLISFKSRNFDLEVTPEHQIFYQKRWDRRMGRSDYEFIDAKKLPPEARFYRSSKWQGKNIKSIKIGKSVIETEDYCKLMGWFLSEGSVTKRGDKYQISISQQKYKDELINDLSNLPYKLNIGKAAVYISDNDLGEYLFKFGKSYEKYIPEEIKKLDTKYIRIFLDAFRLGDGSTIKETKWKGGEFREGRIYFTSSKRMADDLGELMLKVGKRPSYKLQKNKGKSVKHKNGTYVGNHNIWIVRECYSQGATLSSMKVKEINYNDIVYCVELEKNHTLYVRKNGKCVWCGNCRCTLAPVFIGGKGMPNKKSK